MTPAAQAVLSFWLDPAHQPFWFAKSEAFDQTIAQHFSATLKQAASGELAHWRNTAEGRVAEIIVLDQFSRNLHRNSPQAFSQDAMALALAQELLIQPEFNSLPQVLRRFALMPFMHSESALIHQQAVQLFTELGDPHTLDFELRHKEIIDRFGRYPHRNETLGRLSTDEELAFLTEEGSSF